MGNAQENIVNCSQFEELLSDYLEKALDGAANKAVAEHAMACPLCHTLLNEVRDSLNLCREIASPAPQLTRLEARILSMTAPETAMSCADFEEHLSDYLDGFLPAAIFHRWERHAVLCSSCEDLPGMVVRSIASCYSYKQEELAVPAGLHDRILEATLGTVEAAELKPSLGSAFAEWLRGFRLPFGVPQLAPVAMMILVAFMVLSQGVSADGSIASVYRQGVDLAGATVKQSADALNGSAASPQNGEPVSGATYVGGEERR
jgi:hypothetical protein